MTTNLTGLTIIRIRALSLIDIQFYTKHFILIVFQVLSIDSFGKKIDY